MRSLRHNQMFTYNDTDDFVTVYGHCVFTNKEHSIRVPEKEFFDWYETGDLIQNCMPNVSAEDREFLISGISPEGWATTFPDEEDC